MSEVYRKVFNAVLYQSLWFALIIGSGRGIPAFALIVIVVGLVIHGLVLRPTAHEWRFIGIVGAYGLLHDTALALAGAMSFGDQALRPWLCPAWLVGIWICFGTTLFHSLSILENKPALAAALGAVGGPIAYFGGSKISDGQILFPEAPLVSLVALAIVWGVTVPLLFKIKQSTAPRPL